jgi:peptidylprolyl isomerase
MWKRSWLAGALGRAFLTLAVCSAAVATGAAEKADRKEPKTITTKSGLKYRDLKVGKGDAVKKGDTVVVHYTGWLYKGGKKGKKFDSSRGKEPFEFEVGGRVIAGWNEGVVGMRPGGKRVLIIPSKLGYGEEGAGDDIPPNADLIFEVELIRIAK